MFRRLFSPPSSLLIRPPGQTQYRRRKSAAGDRVNLSRRLPSLTDFPEVAFPSFRHSVRNWFFSHALITPYFDSEFSVKDFLRGAEVAVDLVSHSLARGELDDLKDKVEPECLDLVSKNLSLLSMKQRAGLAVKREDIYLSFIYQIGVILEDVEEKGEVQHTRHVEISMVGHSFPHFDDMVNGERLIRDVKDKLDKAGGPVIVNYRFIRDFTKGVEDDWTISALNHFILEEMGT